MSTSFISEHSAEFILVPKFAEILSSRFDNILPIYFWVSREGSRMAKACLRGISLRIVAMYARRPKIERPDQEEILVKFNSILLDRAKYFQHFGIPVFAGVPRVSSISDFKLDAECSWFRISTESEINYDVGYLLDIKAGRVMEGLSEQIIPVNESAIIKTIQMKSRSILWEEAVKIIRGVASDDISSWYYPGNYTNYKPVYFLINV